MSVISVDHSYETLSLTLVAEFDAPAEQVWQLWADPRKLERWWGPPYWPATFTDHDLTPGGTMKYYMTSPEGEKYHGWWRIESVDPGRGLEMVDGFSDAAGIPDPSMPSTRMRMQLSEESGRTRMEMHSTFDSREQMEQLVAMGMVDGLKLAVGQMDDLL